VENNQPTATKKEYGSRSALQTGFGPRPTARPRCRYSTIWCQMRSSYSPPNTTIQVHTLPEAGSILVSVRDEGPGISEDDQKKLFQKFTRLSARPTGGESSTGLGLSIVKRLAEAMLGTIECHSVIGFGATFTLRAARVPGGSHPGGGGQTRHPDTRPRGSTGIIAGC